MLTDLIDFLTDLYNALATPLEMFLKKTRNYSNRVSNAILLKDNSKEKILLSPQIAEQLNCCSKTKSILLCFEKQSRNQQGYRAFGLSAENKYLWDAVVVEDIDFLKQGRYYIIKI